MVDDGGVVALWRCGAMRRLGPKLIYILCHTMVSPRSQMCRKKAMLYRKRLCQIQGNDPFGPSMAPSGYRQQFLKVKLYICEPLFFGSETLLSPEAVLWHPLLDGVFWNQDFRILSASQSKPTSLQCSLCSSKGPF